MRLLIAGWVQVSPRIKTPSIYAHELCVPALKLIKVNGSTAICINLVQINPKDLETNSLKGKVYLSWFLRLSSGESMQRTRTSSVSGCESKRICEFKWSCNWEWPWPHWETFAVTVVQSTRPHPTPPRLPFYLDPDTSAWSVDPDYKVAKAAVGRCRKCSISNWSTDWKRMKKTQRWHKQKKTKDNEMTPLIILDVLHTWQLLWPTSQELWQ